MIIGTTKKGIGGSMIASIQQKKLQEMRKLSEGFKTLIIMPICKPKEIVVIDDVDQSGNIKYWHDNMQIHQVPK
jgi:hypothetical protein